MKVWPYLYRHNGSPSAPGPNFSRFFEKIMTIALKSRTQALKSKFLFPRFPSLGPFNVAVPSLDSREALQVALCGEKQSPGVEGDHG